ncbi:MAG: hypothetical protein F4Z00_12450 [Acidimicrobiaceae bacterium]|nr:hypothetical protein [Acidimicrobiaceae bacterium]MXZ66337.1 hypothetical protein [Acidimicrobiaceae bacterium]MYF32305.1 hypothetical protein [Acidimicrobiaceae bacterium]MYG77534.1 hypothetical protein [Acidimicrobiaceae bacterium]
MAVIALVLLVFASAAIAHITMASWRSTLRVDADTEAANVLGSAINVVDAVVVRYGPQQASTRIETGWHSLPGRDGCESQVLEGCWTAEFTEGTEQVVVPGRDTPVVLPVWRATIAAAARCDRMPTSVADAKEVCEAVTSDATGTQRPAVLVYETSGSLPVLPTLWHSGRLWPESEDATTADCLTAPEDTPMWCAIPQQSRPPAVAYADPSNWLRVGADHIAGAGLFVNTEGRALVLDTCPEGDCEAANPGEYRTLARAHGTEDLALPEGACTADPAVWEWAKIGHNAATEARNTWDSELARFVAALGGDWSVPNVRTEWANTVFVALLDDVADDDIQAVVTPTPTTDDAERAAAEALAQLTGVRAPRDPGTLLEADETSDLTLSAAPNGGMAVAKGSIRITGNIDGDDPNTPELEVLLIVSGCHIIIDGPCDYDIDPTPERQPSPSQPCVDPEPVNAEQDSRERVVMILNNVVIVAAGGIWATDLALPSPPPCPMTDNPDTTDIDETDPGYRAPDLSIVGSVITGHAGVTGRLYGCDGGAPDRIVAGYARTSSLPPDTSRWVEANIAWWPGREDGVWRRR